MHTFVILEMSTNADPPRAESRPILYSLVFEVSEEVVAPRVIASKILSTRYRTSSHSQLLPHRTSIITQSNLLFSKSRRMSTRSKLSSSTLPLHSGAIPSSRSLRTILLSFALILWRSMDSRLKVLARAAFRLPLSRRSAQARPPLVS